MTAATSASVPSNINSVEEILVWAAMALAQLNPTLKILEAENVSEFAAVTQVFKAADGTDRILVRCTIPLNSAYRTDNSVKFWKHADDLSNTALPSVYTTN